MSAAEWVSVTWRTLSCGECGIQFQVPEAFDRERRESGGGWYCPNGHCRVYRTREVDKLKKQLEREQQRRRWAESDRNRTERSARATRGHLTRLKKRVAAGVCPRCNRTFKQLARHMKSQHPDYCEGGEHG